MEWEILSVIYLSRLEQLSIDFQKLSSDKFLIKIRIFLTNHRIENNSVIIIISSNYAVSCNRNIYHILPWLRRIYRQETTSILWSSEMKFFPQYENYILFIVHFDGLLQVLSIVVFIFRKNSYLSYKEKQAQFFIWPRQFCSNMDMNGRNNKTMNLNKRPTNQFCVMAHGAHKVRNQVGLPRIASMREVFRIPTNGEWSTSIILSSSRFSFEGYFIEKFRRFINHVFDIITT